MVVVAGAVHAQQGGRALECRVAPVHRRRRRSGARDVHHHIIVVLSDLTCCVYDEL